MGTRKYQLRAAKRRQRQRELQVGRVVYQLTLPLSLRDRLKAGMKETEFVARFEAFLRHEVIRVDDYAELKLLCWNQDIKYMTREDAFRLYERNWRMLDGNSLDEYEVQLLLELKDEYGRGVINA